MSALASISTGYSKKCYKGKNAEVLISDLDALYGSLKMVQKSPKGKISIRFTLTGLTPNQLHGIHIHESANFTQGCNSTGGHFNPFGKNHGAPSAKEHHVGDLGNVLADSQGMVDYTANFDLPSLYGENSIIGRAVVLRARADDLGLNATSPDSLKTGNAGARMACGRIFTNGKGPLTQADENGKNSKAKN